MLDSIQRVIDPFFTLRRHRDLDVYYPNLTLIYQKTQQKKQ